MKIAIACDHGGFPLKQEVCQIVEAAGCEILDLGAYEYDRLDDYPEFARAAGEAIQKNQADRAIIICGSGLGACVAANKMVGVRAGVCHDTYSAHQGVEHDDVNALCLGARVVGVEVAREIVQSFLNARFSGEERHQRRLDKVLAIESGNLAS